MKKETRNLLLINLGLFLLFITDRLIKWLALNLLADKSFSFLKIFRLELYLNKGISFSLPLYQPIIYLVNFIFILILFSFLIKAYQKRNIKAILGITLMISGAFSNLLDRFSFGAIVDFINLSFLPIFNLADLMILAGVFILVFKKSSLSESHESR